MQIPPHVNDGSNKPPRLQIYGNEWGLLELPKFPRAEEWSWDKKMDKLVEIGFDGCQVSPVLAPSVRKRGLRYCTSTRINTPADADAKIKEASDSGADCTTVHAGWGVEDDSQADALVHAILEASAKHKVPAYIETHRATLAADIWRINKLIQRIPEVRFNGDYSHLYLGGEVIYPGFEIARPLFVPILQRTSFFHGRISNNESIQIDVGDGKSNPHAKNFQSLWTEAMTHWLKTAKPGDILPFTPELGPPSSGYSITYTDHAGTLVEISDRWQQMQVLKRLADECFAAAKDA